MAFLYWVTKGCAREVEAWARWGETCIPVDVCLDEEGDRESLDSSMEAQGAEGTESPLLEARYPKTPVPNTPPMVEEHRQRKAGRNSSSG